MAMNLLVYFILTKVKIECHLFEIISFGNKYVLNKKKKPFK